MKTCYFYILLLFALLTTACSQDDDQQIAVTPEKGIVTIVVQMPSHRLPSSYGLSEADENKVNELAILAFKDYAGTEKLEEKILIAAGSTDISNDGAGNMKAKVMLPPGHYNRIVLIANANTQANTLAAGATLADLEQLQYTHSTGQWNASTPDYIPMWGESKASTLNGFEIKLGVSKTFQGLKLIRMLASINLLNGASTGFTLNNVYVYNMAKNGYIVADGNYSANPSQPHLPTLQSANSPLVYDFATLSVANGTPNKLEGEIYAFENNAPVLATIASSPRIVVEGTYLADGGTYYYPVDFVYDGSKAGTTRGDFMAIVRNHKYIFTISQVNGPGFSTANDALATTSIFTNNLIVTPLVIDDDFTDVYFNASDFLAVNSADISLPLTASTTATSGNKFDVLSSLPWTITCTESDGVTAPVGNWLSVSSAGGAAHTQSTVSIVTTATGSTRTGYLLVKAGSLTADKIKVVQKP